MTASKHPSNAGLVAPSVLIANQLEDYGERFRDHLLEQYKLYVDSSHKTGERRLSAGNFLLAVNSSILTALGIAAGTHFRGASLAAIPAAGIIVCVAWAAIITSYRNLNTAKFKVIHELENHLPAALFRAEWKACGEGKTSAYRQVSHLERWVPAAFGILYLAILYFLLRPLV